MTKEEAMEEGQPAYRVYLLRSWRDDTPAPEARGVWRYSLEDPNTRQRRGFADLEALSGYLAALTESRPAEGNGRAVDETVGGDVD